MQRQHQQLHTHEKILRYELSQKRKMLTELKQELEYCREKWEQAREKNSNTEEQWKQLRSEFALRKVTTVDDLNNSAESGYSDERECSSDDDSSYDANKNKSKTNSSQSSPVKTSSDTEDNDEISHGSDAEDLLESAFSKACSASALQQPKLKLSEVYVLNSDASSATENTHVETTNEEQITDVTIGCDNDIVTEDITETLHSSDTLPQTELTVQIEDNLHTDVQDEEIQTNSSQNSDETQTCTETVVPSSSHCSELQKTDDELPNETEISQNSVKEAMQSSNADLQSTSQSVEQVQRTSEEILSKREERLRRLEEQCKLLVKKVTNTTNRRAELSSRIQTLHEQYGSSSENVARSSEERNRETHDSEQNSTTEEKGEQTSSTEERGEQTSTIEENGEQNPTTADDNT